jgi:hypothetical protein
LASWGKAVLATAVGVLLLGSTGCGEGEGTAAGATVAAYVEAPLCVGARRELASEGGRAGSVRVRAVCLKGVREGRRLDLATVGANARRATEDSATVAYVEAPATPSFSRPIVEAANVAVIRDRSGQVAMQRLLGAIGEAGSGSLRDAVREALG